GDARGERLFDEYVLAMIQSGFGQLEVSPDRSYDSNNIDLGIAQDFLGIGHNLHVRESFCRALLRLLTLIGDGDNLRHAGQVEVAGDVWSPVSVSDHAYFNHEFTYEVPFLKIGPLLNQFLSGDATCGH